MDAWGFFCGGSRPFGVCTSQSSDGSTGTRPCGDFDSRNEGSASRDRTTSRRFLNSRARGRRIRIDSPGGNRGMLANGATTARCLMRVCHPSKLVNSRRACHDAHVSRDPGPRAPGGFGRRRERPKLCHHGQSGLQQERRWSRHDSRDRCLQWSLYVVHFVPLFPSLPPPAFHTCTFPSIANLPRVFPSLGSVEIIPSRAGEGVSRALPRRSLIREFLGLAFPPIFARVRITSGQHRATLTNLSFCPVRSCLWYRECRPPAAVHRLRQFERR